MRLGSAATSILKSSAQAHGLSLTSMLLGAWAILLARYSGDERVLFEFTRMGSQDDSAKKTIPLRVRVFPGEPALDLLQRIHALQAEATELGDWPRDETREASPPSKDRPPLESAFILREVPAMASHRSSHEGAIGNGNPVTDHPLAVIAEVGEELALAIQFEGPRFTSDAISRMLGHLQTLLGGISANPHQSVSRLPLLTPEERRQLLVDWNDTEQACPRDACLHHLFEQQVARNPKAVAIFHGEARVTYAELDRRANQLARHLKALGVGPEARVGISVERSVELAVGILGILKAGGAYVPIDPTYPRSRLSFMLRDSKVSLLLTQQRLAEELLPADLEAPAICLDADWPLISQQTNQLMSGEATAENLAYVIYTSGTTGAPKGIALQHRGVVNNLVDLNTRFHVGPESLVLAISSLGFDMCVYEVLGTLAAGGAIVMPDATKAKEPAHWAELIRKHQVTVWNSAPQLLEMLLAYLEDRPELHPRSLRLAILGGDWVPVSLPDRLRSLAEDATVAVLGGATESSIHSTVYVVERVDPSWTSIPYGRPMANQRIYVLDPHLEPVPIGVPGELYLGGVGLARGYFERAELTAEKFVANPFSSDPGERIFKTGDLVRYLPDGNVELLGRLDHQVKIRGNRIELGEIEAALRRHPLVDDAVVMAREDQRGEKSLVAYAVPTDHDTGTPDGGDRETEEISSWEAIYDEAYRRDAEAEDPRRNFAGWISSFTGAPFSEEELCEVVDHTVERILALQPDRVLEIGCGTGLLLFRVAPYCTRYDATDLSQVVLDSVAEELRRPGQALQQVTLFRRSADNFDGVTPEVYDTVILNSVSQHLPSIAYFLRVLEGAVTAVRSGGSVLVGDVRCLQLLEAYHTAVELHRQPNTCSVRELRQRVQRRIAQEKELWVDPAFFTAVKSLLPKVTGVEILLKRGRHLNEISKFHFDVVLHTGSLDSRSERPTWLRWQQGESTWSAVRRHLANTQPEVLGVADVPNARLLTEVTTHSLLAVEDDDSPNTVGALREALGQTPPGEGVDPEDFWAAADEAPYAVNVRWPRSNEFGCFDVLFSRSDHVAKSGDGNTAEVGDRRTSVPSTQGHSHRPWARYGNRPLAISDSSQLVPALRAHLSRVLPDYMVPAAFVFLTALPLSPNGKIDRRALPSPEHLRPELQTRFAAPRTAVEAVLAGIWAEVLGIESVGVFDDFFDLGGHSLMATQIGSRVEERLHVVISLKSLFDQRSVARLAEHIETTAEAEAVDVRGIAEILLEISELSEDDAAAMLAMQPEQRAWSNG